MIKYDTNRVFDYIPEALAVAAAPLENNKTFTEFVNAYSAKMFSIAYYITKNKSVSEDIVQEVFLKLWQKRTTLIPDNIGGWLHKVTANYSYNYLRRESRKIQIIRFLQVGENKFHTEVEERLAKKEHAAVFRKALTLLPGQQKIVYQLSKEHGFSRDEIAAHLNISPNTVKVHLLKAARFMKEYIGRICVFFIFLLINILFYKNSNTKNYFRCLHIVDYTLKSNLIKTEDDPGVLNNSFVITKYDLKNRKPLP